jgi:hypothetical protein
MDETPQLHPDVVPLAFLLGEWAGEGHGEYPTIEPFPYQERVRFWHVGKPFLAYTQATTHGVTGLPAHAEMGYWRCFPTAGGGPGHVEVVLSHPSGISEVLEGTVDGTTLDLHTTSVIGTTTAKDVTALTRRFQLEGEVLRYDVAMAAVGQPLTHHLHADLRRT